MKNLLSLFIFLLFALYPLTAQVEYGVKAGVNLANVFSNDVSISSGQDIEGINSSTVVKPQFGVWINVPFRNNISIQPELLFTQKAWLPADIDGAITLNFDYISLPLMLNYHYKNWRFEAGPEISYLLDQYFSEPAGIFGDENPSIDEKVLELAINAGVRYQLKRWQVGLRYNFDITPFVSYDVTDINGEPIANDQLSSYHRCLQLALGYRLN